MRVKVVFIWSKLREGRCRPAEPAEGPNPPSSAAERVAQTPSDPLTVKGSAEEKAQDLANLFVDTGLVG